MLTESQKAQWEADCLHWQGRVLTGEKAHWCMDWDCLPIDETCPEIDCCNCFPAKRSPKVRKV